MILPKKEDTEKRFNFIVDADFKKKVQIKCLKKGITVTDLIINLLSKWLNEK